MVITFKQLQRDIFNRDLKTSHSSLWCLLSGQGKKVHPCKREKSGATDTVQYSLVAIVNDVKSLSKEQIKYN